MDALTEAIAQIREANPTWGRHRIFKQLTDDGFETSSATVQRRMNNPTAEPTSKELEALLKKFNPSEIKAMLKGAETKSSSKRIEWGNEKVTIGIMSDTHIGHEKFNEAGWWAAADAFEGAGVDFVYHAGDIVEGMSGRPGHIYELSQIGFEAQFGSACELIESFPMQIRGITGNHDLWYQQKADIGINIGKRFEAECKNWVHLGDHEADEWIGNIHNKIWHGNDGASYAASYRGQKIVESFSGGEKPHVLITGHDHKALAQWVRNVFHVGAGTLCGQSGFMRGKKLQAHEGFWIVEQWQNDSGLERIRPEWFPLYR